MYRFSSFLLCMILLLAPDTTFTQIKYVSPSGTGTGSSWADASSDLKAILDAATYGTEIWVAEGIYYPQTCDPCQYSDRQISFQIPDGVRLYGGFAGMESHLSERDWDLHPTRLSGDIDGDGTAANNAFTVIFTDRVSEATWVDGFIISHANADDLTTIYGTRGNSGGGWFNDGIFEPLGSNPIIRNCTFEYNQVLGFGGAMYNEGSFSGQASPQLISCTIQYNSAEKGGGGIYNNGVFEGVSSPSLIACRLSNNFTVNSGAALYNNGLEGVSNPQITNCFFYENEATTYGAGMYNLGKTGSASPMIINCNFCSNKATAAGAIYNLGSESGNSSPEVINCTFYDNEAEVGACIYNQAGDPTGNCSPKVSNSIFWGNIAPFGLIFQNGYGTPHINHCLVEVADCDALNSGLNGNVSCGDGMIFNQDPMFMEPASNNLHLQSLSPAIDLGSNDVIRSTGVEVDLDSLDRFHNAVVDLGAYEYHTDQYIAPAVAQSPMSLNICEGERAQLEVLASGTGPLSYQWQKDAVDIPGEQDSLLVITSSSPADMGQYRCLIIGARMDTIISQSASLMVQPLLTPELLIQTTATEICSGETLTFTAQATHPGMNPQYQWLLNNQLINGANGLTYTSSSLAEGDLIQCQVISSESCLTSNMAQSNGLSPTVLPILNPSISISASSLEICEGETIDFSSIVVEAGMDAIYEWQINGQAIGDTDNFSTSVLNDGDVVRCRLQSLDPCATTAELFSNELSIIVQPLLSPTISISASSLEICEGETIDFSSVVATAGLDAIYEWQVNGQAIGNTNNFSTSVLNDGDVVRCRLQSLDPCATTTELFSNELSITVQPILSPTISISASSLEICEGEAIDFSSIVAEAGLGAVYEWQINGQAIGNTDNFSTSILNDGDVVRCRLQSLDPCAATTELFSNELSITVQPILSPTISISASSLEICEGETIDFSSIVAAAGLDAIYEWQINGQVMGNTANFSTSTLNDGDVVRCKLQSLAPCTSTTEVLSNELTVIISEVLQPQLSITADATSICAGDTVYFTAQPQEAGANFELQWEWNGQVVGEGDINWQSTNLQEGDEVTCTMQTTALCSDTNFVRAPGLFFEVAPVLAPSISISASALTICSGETVDFSALVADAGSDFSFQWEVNQIPVNIDQVNFSIANLEDGDIIRCLLTSYYTCAFPAQVMSEELTIHVLPQLMPTIDVEVSATSICAGEEVIFAAYPNAAGDSLTYQWLRNSQEVGNDTTALILADLNDGDTVQCRLMTSHPCIEQGSILSDPIVIEVQPILHPSVEIIADTTSICAGEPIQFTAAHLEAGANPSYQWLLNGVLIVGANNLEWMVDSLSDGGVVQGQLISQSPCVIDSIAYSNELDIQVNPWVEATLSIETSATSICEGDTVLLEAFPTNGGQNPAYSWMINGIMVGDKPMWSTSTLADQDEVQCQMRSSAACVSEPLIEAASITFEVDECLVGLEDRSGSALIRLYPNPSTGWVYLDLQQDAFPISIAVMDLTGRHLMDGGHWEETNRLDLSHLSDGVYLIWIRGKDYSFKDQIIICK